MGKHKKLIFTFLAILVFTSAYPEREWSVYFTTPGRGRISGVINPLNGLVNVIRGAEKTFYGAFYDISSEKIAEELVLAYKRGIDVKLVTERSTFSGSAVKKIIAAGIPVVTDTGTGLMHNKFAVIDGEMVFTGSYNTTDNGAFKNNNNAVIIRSAELAGIYRSEFLEMFGGGIFGNRSEKGAFAEITKKYYVKTPGLDINVYFSPEDNIENIIYGRLKKARKSIRFLQFSFTSDRIGELLIEKFKEGISVSGVFEKKGSGSEFSEYVKMKVEGVPVKLDRNRYVMHHKVLIIDDYRVITGSYNLSKNANIRNDENILIIDSSEVAREYISEFNRIYSGAK